MKTNSIIFALVLVLLLSSCFNLAYKIEMTGLANAVAGINLIISFPSQPVPEIPSPPSGGAGGGGGGAACTPDWECGEWEECINDIQTQICKDTRCGNSDNIKTRECQMMRYIGDVDQAAEIGEEGISYLAGELETVIFTAKGLNHTATVIDVQPTYVDIEVFSERIVVRVNIYDTVYVDLENDGIYDISITVHDIKDGRADVTIKQIIIPPVIINAPAMPAVSVKNLYLTLFLVCIILAILALFFATKKKVKKTKH